MGVAQARKVTWLDLWRHTTQDCEAALVLRLALDDSAPGVISSAAAALHALLGSSHGIMERDFLDPGGTHHTLPATCVTLFKISVTYAAVMHAS